MKAQSEYSQHIARALEAVDMAVKVADLRHVAYDPAWIYLNRIGEKVRILKASDAIGNGGTIRAAIKITWNPDLYSREQVAGYVRRLLPAIKHFATRGSVHPFRVCSEVGLLLAGGLDERTPRTWGTKAPGALTAADARQVRMKVQGL